MKASGDTSLPELRIKDFDNFGKLEIRFTSDINLREDIDQSIGTKIVHRGRRLETESKNVSSLIDVVVVSGAKMNYDEDEDTYESKLTALKSWEIKKIDQSGMEIKFVFNSPLSISTDDTPDYAFIQIALAQISDDPDLSESIIKQVMIPTQMASQE